MVCCKKVHLENNNKKSALLISFKDKQLQFFKAKLSLIDNPRIQNLMDSRKFAELKKN